MTAVASPTTPRRPPDLDCPVRKHQCMRIVADCHAAVAKRKWRADVRARKLTIADGVGEVHGRYYDVEGQYGPQPVTPSRPGRTETGLAALVS